MKNRNKSRRVELRCGILMLVSILLLFFSCKKNSENSATKLIRTESVDNSDKLFHTEYKYDNEDRIIEIRQFESNADSAFVIAISYNANEVILLSHPLTEPLDNQTEEIHLYLDGNGRLKKRIQYTHGVPKNPADPSETFRFDTLFYKYDVGGLLISSEGSRYDSLYLDSYLNQVKRFNSIATYTNLDGNLVSTDENVTYPIITRRGGVADTTGGSSEYQQAYNYSKSYPNRSDFRNAIVLNEFKLYYESPLNVAYKNMPDQVLINNVDKDRNGTIIFSSTGTIAMERSYGPEGLLSTVDVTTLNTPYKKISFFYGK